MSQGYSFTCPECSFTIDFSNLGVEPESLPELEVKCKYAHEAMCAIEAGQIKNPDEKRKVTHFTDRMVYPESALFADVEAFAQSIACARIVGSTGKPFTQAVINGIGGSALGPQLMQFAINGPYWNELSNSGRRHFLKLYFTDNTDPAGVADLMPVLDLESTLIVSISKSGGTQETQNNLIAFETEFKQAGLAFEKHAVAITMHDSKLDKKARAANWLAVFEMADSIGGRTSETSIVGHLPAALAGIDFKAFLSGACAMDQWTRQPLVQDNPAYFLAVAWYILGNGRGDRNMVVVPYSDRLILFSRYLQQLVMESLGKERDLDGKVVHQGLSVFGNKGGTDAHAFIQQLHDGRDDFFVTFIENFRDAKCIPINGSITMGDYLHGFESGLAEAFRVRGRRFLRIGMDGVTPANLGRLIALFERAVAYYAELIHINAFHQPGVEAYKLAAKAVIALNGELFEKLPAALPFEGMAQAYGTKLGIDPKFTHELELILTRLALNAPRESLPFTVTRKWNDGIGAWVFKAEKRA